MAFVCSKVGHIVFARNPKVNHVWITITLMNLVRPPRTVTNELGIDWPWASYKTLRNWFTVTYHPYLRDHGIRP